MSEHSTHRQPGRGGLEHADEQPPETSPEAALTPDTPPVYEPPHEGSWEPAPEPERDPRAFASGDVAGSHDETDRVRGR